MKQISKRLFGVLLAIIMVVSMVPTGFFKVSASAAVSTKTY